MLKKIASTAHGPKGHGNSINVQILSMFHGNFSDCKKLDFNMLFPARRLCFEGSSRWTSRRGQSHGKVEVSLPAFDGEPGGETGEGSGGAKERKRRAEGETKGGRVPETHS